MHTTFLSENLKGRDHSEDLGVDGKIILEELDASGSDWDQCRALVNTAMNLLGP
jgi:hypothetical protein